MNMMSAQRQTWTWGDNEKDGLCGLVGRASVVASVTNLSTAKNQHRSDTNKIQIEILKESFFIKWWMKFSPRGSCQPLSLKAKS